MQQDGDQAYPRMAQAEWPDERAGMPDQSPDRMSVVGGRKPGVAEATAALHVQDVTTLTSLHALRDDWEALLDRDPGATVFQRFDWTVAWYECFGRRKALHVLAVRDQAGRLVGLVPTSVAQLATGAPRVQNLLGWPIRLTEYVDGISEPVLATQVTEAVLETLDRHASDWDLLALPLVPADRPLAGLGELARRRGYSIQRRDYTRSRGALPESWEALYRSLPKSMKENVNNYVNRLRRDGHEERLIVVEGGAELDGALDEFLRLHRLRAKSSLGPVHQDQFCAPDRQAFLRKVAHRLSGSGVFRVMLLHVNGRPVAAQLCLVDRGRLYLYYSGFDPAWGRYGVMTVLTRRCLEWGIAQGCREVDMMIGSGLDKRRWGLREEPVVSLVLANRRARSRLALAGLRMGRQVLQLVRQIRASSPQLAVA
jgi:CelD/BcsL family acetyltransferase involved in cellulose biosynthesis